ncbi:ribulose-phosphate 3-epimerase, partial [Enterococcus faecalis]
MKEYILAPSLFSSKISRLVKTLETLEIEEIKWLHVDVMDGYFVPDMASGPSIVKELKEITDIILDVHLMVE